LNPPVVHRDLATKNILLTTEDHPKIADLGVAKVFAAGKDAFATVVPGTPLYAAPETYPIKKGLAFCTEVMYGVKVDIFSFGVLLLVIIVGEEPTVWPLSPLKGKQITPKYGLRIEQIWFECETYSMYSML
jgi:serine/threonine protein kinase